MKVKTSYVPEDVTYLTAGKIYKVVRGGDEGFNIDDDTGIEIFCSMRQSAHIDYRDWEIVEND